MAKAYKENKIDIRPSIPNGAVDIQIPTHENGQRRARFTIASGLTRETFQIKDEDDYTKRFLATQGSFYFRQRKVYPRTFLWRVVNGSKILEIQAVDLARSSHDQHEASLMLRFDFQEEIIPSGVALADAEDHEVLNVFVLTGSNRLHTLALRAEFFRRAASIDENISDWCRSSTPAPLTFAHPHRLHASSTTELFISLDNGALLRLTRRAGDDGSQWSQITFDEKSWGQSIRGLVKWNAPAPVRYKGHNLDQNTANAIATTPDQTHVFAVCLNHTLKIWNLATNKLVGSKDLLDREIKPSEPPSYFLNPLDTGFIRIFNAERAIDGGYRFYIATYSPYEEGRFKFWAAKGGLTTQLTIEDLFPHVPLRPLDPDPSGNVFWNVADFQIRSRDEGDHMELWVLWRNNNIYKVHTLHFDFHSLVEDWSTNWMVAAVETRRSIPPPPLLVSDNIDPTEKWVEYLFCPGRYSQEVLETALAIYQEILRPSSSNTLGKKGNSLEDQLCSAIGASVSLRKLSETELDFGRFGADTDNKWRQFWQIAEDVNRRRHEPISLSYDAFRDMAWIMLADSCVLLREASSTELLFHNSATDLEKDLLIVGDRWRHRKLESELGNQGPEAAYLLEVASFFRKRLTAEALRSCQVALDEEIFSEPSISILERLETFQERSALGEQVSDATFDSLCATMNEKLNIYNLPNDLFYAVLDTIPTGFPGKDSELVSTAFGLKVIVEGAQETICLTRQALFDLLILVVFISGEISQEEKSTFNAPDLFSVLVETLREYEMMYWLSTTVRPSVSRSLQAVSSRQDLSSPVKGSEVKRDSRSSCTILEDLFAVHLKPRPTAGIPQSFALTQGVRDVLSWITRQGEVALPNVLVFIQCDLIANGNLDLAEDFLRFQPSTAWATYAKGRLHVARSNFDVAALQFQKAAYLLSSGRALGNLHEMSSNLLDMISVDNFNNGLPRYFQHIVSVFEKAGSFSHVAEFVNLALKALDSDAHKGEHGADIANLRTDLLSRLFYAALKTCQFDKAYSALSRYTDMALQKSALGSLITSLFAAWGSGAAALEQLLHFPLSLAPNLLSCVDDILLSLANKQTSFTSAFDYDDNKWETNRAPDWQKILHAYRVARNDFRGAAEISYQTVQRLRKTRDTPSRSRLALAKPVNGSSLTGQKAASSNLVEEDDPESKEIRHELLALINLLACVDKSEAYILVEIDGGSSTQAREESPGFSHRRTSTASSTALQDDGNVLMDDAPSAPTTSSHQGSHPSPTTTPTKATHISNHSRAIITLDHLRREYQGELDRVSRIERGDWEFGALDPEEEDDDDDDDDDVIDGDHTMVLS